MGGTISSQANCLSCLHNSVVKSDTKNQMPTPVSETFLYNPQPPHADAIRVGWVYPYSYSVSMSSLGYLMLFQQLDQNPNVAVNRINTDNMAQEPISDLELMGVSFSFELDVLEILNILNHYGLPFYARDRSDDVPLLFAGGPVVMTNPEPYADFFDFFLIGEGEEALNTLIEAMKTLRHLPKKERLLALAQAVPGIYVPSLYDVTYAPAGEILDIRPNTPGVPFPIEKQWIKSMSEVIAATPILTVDTVFSNTFLVEVMRGCAHRCRFCLASYSMLPARGPSLDSVIAAIETGLRYTPKIGLLGALIADHPEFDALCSFIKAKEGIQVTAASLRADTMTDHIAQTFAHGGQQNVTLAIETGSEKLRRRINKHLKTEAILNAASITARAGIKNLKLYTMVGLPGEDMQDLEDTVALAKAIKKENPLLKIALGNSTFVPKAATPFQWVSRETSKDLEQKQAYLRKALVKIADFRPQSPKWDFIQAALSRGDRRLSAWIIAFWQSGANLGALNRVAKQFETTTPELPLPPLAWYALRERPVTEILPWDTLFLGVSKEILYKESGLATPQPIGP